MWAVPVFLFIRRCVAFAPLFFVVACGPTNRPAPEAQA